ncbi:hypothetical protein ACFPLB_10025 [Aquamicrobium segne]|uniref:DUF2946 domain-containing protein n=1 Tax=Aquamicrobium segne TaxID=469547 RepID=A0ABW0GXC7_9HYPH
MALAAAWFLILQSVSGAFALAAWPQTMQLDAFGNVICTHQGISEPSEGHTPAMQHHCCVLGCTPATPLPAGLPSPVPLQAPLSFINQSFKASAPDHLSFMRERSPAIPRAPPVMA